MEKLTKLQALEHLAGHELYPNNEYTQAAMYLMMCRIINSDEELFDLSYLENLIVEAELF